MPYVCNSVSSDQEPSRILIVGKTQHPFKVTFNQKSTFNKKNPSLKIKHLTNSNLNITQFQNQPVHHENLTYHNLNTYQLKPKF